jgi:hypothetical protein
VVWRGGAREARIDADLAAGRHADLVSELERLVAREPLRERPRAQLMLALYRCARQAEALAVYRAARIELAGGLGLEPLAALRRLEAAILRQDPELDLPEAPAAGAILVVPGTAAQVALAERLAAPLILACVVAPERVAAATAELARRAIDGVRVAAFSSPAPAADLARLAAREACALVLIDAADEAARELLAEAACDVALLTGAVRDGPVVVPFGAGRHDWSALDLGARVARATGASLQLVGAVSGRRSRDASRLLADASLIVQRRTGVVALPQLARPGRRGLVALAADAGLLVIGVPDDWREQGLGRLRRALLDDPPAPTALVRRAEAAQAPSLTRFTWSRTL